jgi:MFS family permease
MVVPRRLGVGFRWLLASSWISNLGDGITLAAGPLLVASQTKAPLLVAMAVLLQRLPWLLFGLYAGVIADRLDRRRVVVAVDLMRTVVLTVLAVSIVTGWVNIAVVLVVMFLLGTAEAFADTTSSTLVPMLVDKADLGIANSRLIAGFVTVNELAGPPIGAALFAAGMAWPFASEAVCVLLGAVLIAKITLPPHRREVEPGHVRRGHRRGVELALAPRGHAHPRADHRPVQRDVRSRLVGPRSLRHAAARTRRRRVRSGHNGRRVRGVARHRHLRHFGRHFSLGNIMRVGLLIETFTHLTLAITTSPSVAMPVFFVFGAHAAVWGTTSSAVRQRAVPMEFQGRVASVYMMGVMGGLVVGSAVGGVFAQHAGLAAPFWFAFVGSAILLALIWQQLPQIAHSEEGELVCR